MKSTFERIEALIFTFNTLIIQGCTVSHNGIIIVIDSSIHNHENIGQIDILLEKEYKINTDVNEIKGDLEIPFSLEFPEALQNSYDGDLFSIRHSITAKVLRPWYTFDVWSDALFYGVRVQIRSAFGYAL
jgi:hypothetical protein